MSSGMLDAAKNNTSDFDFIEQYAVIDAENIPFDSDSFDIVIANYMLYHVPNIDKALSEISRVLKSNGFFFAATYGEDNLKEVDDIFINFDSRLDSVTNNLCKAFGLENGHDYLNKHFGSVELKRYENCLHITELKPLTEYFLS
ncbi:MAG: class I SAM-dependent methyltransferase [Clostridiales bacterium]|jgi:ubiquinone/menaquinone biosynthesis C-methylase UbiE|nr:class I SAM-dependent methyltransferase [Clostridiales bacterium]